MAARRSEAEKLLDRRHNEAARRETVIEDRGRDATRNLEAALRLQDQAQEFARAFRRGPDARRE